jgi:hypothetical protein
MEQNTDQGLSLETILQQLRELTKERKLVEKSDDTVSRLFAPLLEQSEKVPTWQEHTRNVGTLQKQLSGFSVWWEPRHRVYALIPTVERRGG